MMFENGISAKITLVWRLWIVS